MIQTLGISLIIGLIGYFILDIFVDGVLQDPFAKTVVYIFQRLGLDEVGAIQLYRLIFWKNKALIVGVDFLYCLSSVFILECPSSPRICDRLRREFR
jgi:two-component system sensor histidine kinase VanS